VLSFATHFQRTGKSEGTHQLTCIQGGLSSSLTSSSSADVKYSESSYSRSCSAECGSTSSSEKSVRIDSGPASADGVCSRADSGADSASEDGWQTDEKRSRRIESRKGSEGSEGARVEGGVCGAQITTGEVGAVGAQVGIEKGAGAGAGVAAAQRAGWWRGATDNTSGVVEGSNVLITAAKPSS